MRNVELQTRACGGYAVVMLRGELDATDAGAVAGAVAGVAGRRAGTCCRPHRMGRCCGC